MKKIFYTLTIFIAMLLGCIPIIDRIAPNIFHAFLNNTRKVYNLQDTLRLAITYRDNERLDSIAFTVRGLERESRWQPSMSKKVAGRRFEDTVKVLIPANADLGNYTVEMRCYDVGKNITVQRDTFKVEGDNKPPIITNIVITNLVRDMQTPTRFGVCRSSSVSLAGIAIDNIRIKEASAVMTIAGNATPIFTLNLIAARDTIRFENFFGRDLRVPANVPDNAVITLTITVTDDANLKVVRIFTLVVNCDDSPPEFKITRTFPQINAANEGNVLEGGTFRFLTASLSDNRRLGRLIVSFNDVTQPRKEVFRQDLTSKTENLVDLLKNVSFKIPDNALAGSLYELVLSAADSAGNTAPSLRILLTVLKDQPPSVIIAEASINGRVITLVNDPPLSIGRGESLKIDGKIDDDRDLQSIKIFWGIENQEATMVDLDASQLSNLPVDFADTRLKNTFLVADNAVAGQIYRLRIIVKDSRNPEIIRTFRFVVR